ncbi:helix-turn-helix domain-containing protein [Aliamphritea hakodatensis]|uniref:helix-turn-helix domain-containing protein n=1 Tax=Aliamphritea hakodatensis TaxID=2895352 RepID=UPI0022FD6A7E|nr:helix-turn-helix transcriptional regulator [Aliamphritea hakodatensis]
MGQSALSENIRLLCSYGHSISDICRRAGINRQQFSKYLNGHSEPSLASLRKICDFFGVEEHEIMLGEDSFREIIRLRPPRFDQRKNRFQRIVEDLTTSEHTTAGFFERHEGYYHAYIIPDPAKGHCIRSLSRIYPEDGKWLVKTVERQMDKLFMLPATLKYSGIIMEGCNRIAIYEREQGQGRSLNATFLYPSEHSEPRFLPGLLVGFSAEGAQQISCIRTVWEYLGKKPDLRQALAKCGAVDRKKETLPTFVEQGIGNDMTASEQLFTPRF